MTNIIANTPSAKKELYAALILAKTAPYVKISKNKTLWIWYNYCDKIRMMESLACKGMAESQQQLQLDLS